LEFTEEELKRFRRAQPYDIELAEEIADMGRNVMIGEELFRQQQMEEDQNNLMKTQHVYREIYEI
jgi:stress response protein YsnF